MAAQPPALPGIGEDDANLPGMRIRAWILAETREADQLAINVCSQHIGAVAARVPKRDEALGPGRSGGNSRTEIAVAGALAQGEEQTPEGVVIPVVVAGGAQAHAGAIR